jgi:hypothetical protein
MPTRANDGDARESDGDACGAHVVARDRIARENARRFGALECVLARQ